MPSVGEGAAEEAAAGWYLRVHVKAAGANGGGPNDTKRGLVVTAPTGRLARVPWDLACGGLGDMCRCDSRVGLPLSTRGKFCRQPRVGGAGAIAPGRPATCDSCVTRLVSKNAASERPEAGAGGVHSRSGDVESGGRRSGEVALNGLDLSSSHVAHVSKGGTAPARGVRADWPSGCRSGFDAAIVVGRAFSWITGGRSAGATFRTGTSGRGRPRRGGLRRVRPSGPAPRQRVPPPQDRAGASLCRGRQLAGLR